MTNYKITDHEIVISGHSGYGPAGTDIICAALSTLKLFLVDGLVESGTGTAVCERPDEAYFSVTITEPTESGRFLLRIFEREIDGLRDAFPQFITRTE